MVIIAFLAVAVFYIAAVLYGGFSWGFVLYKLWYWFVLPVFPNLPHIDFNQAVGLMLVIFLFHNTNLPQIKEEYLKDGDEPGKRLLSSVLVPWILLLSCWIIKLFI